MSLFILNKFYRHKTNPFKKKLKVIPAATSASSSSSNVSSKMNRSETTEFLGLPSGKKQRGAKKIIIESDDESIIELDDSSKQTRLSTNTQKSSNFG